MQFPFQFTCQVVTERQKGKGECTITPLWMSIEVSGEVNEYSFLEVEYIGKVGSESLEMKLRNHKTVGLRLRFANEGQLRLCHQYLSKVVPCENYGRLYRCEEICERLSCLNSKIYTAVNVPTKQLVLVRQLSLIGGETLMELEIIMSLINRCSLKPLGLYIQKNELKLVYGYFKGCLLEDKIGRREIYEQPELKDFLVRMLFLLSDLEAAHIELSNLTSDLIILKGSQLRNPVIVDFSCAKRIQGKVTPKHIRQLGEIAFELVMCTEFTEHEYRSLEQWTTGFTPNYCSPLRAYDRRLFELIIEMLKGRKSSAQLLKNGWLRINQKRLGGYRLATIESTPLDYTDTCELAAEGLEREVSLQSSVITKKVLAASLSDEELCDCSDEDQSATQPLGERLQLKESNVGDRLAPYRFDLNRGSNR